MQFFCISATDLSFPALVTTFFAGFWRRIHKRNRRSIHITHVSNWIEDNAQHRLWAVRKLLRLKIANCCDLHRLTQISATVRRKIRLGHLKRVSSLPSLIWLVRKRYGFKLKLQYRDTRMFRANMFFLVIVWNDKSEANMQIICVITPVNRTLG